MTVISRRTLFKSVAGTAMVGVFGRGSSELGATAYEPPTDAPYWSARSDLLYRVSYLVNAMICEGKDPYELRLHPADVYQLSTRLIVERLDFGVSGPDGGRSGWTGSLDIVPCPQNPVGFIEIAYRDRPDWKVS